MKILLCIRIMSKRRIYIPLKLIIAKYKTLIKTNKCLFLSISIHYKIFVSLLILHHCLF